MNIKNLPLELQTGMMNLQKYGLLNQLAQEITIEAKYDEQVSVEKKGTNILITYDTLPHYYMAFARALGMDEGKQVIVPRISKLGLMVDCSRNAVAKVDTVKRLICLMALTGYNYLELYTEDTYELPGEPYFGYKRGRYSAEELKECVEFSKIFGIEIVPCIQTLAHLQRLANWRPYFDHMDIDDILLVDDERTYALIRKMLTFCREVFDTDRINIGMDEAFRVGRGKYTDINGYMPKQEVYIRHVKKVFEMCRELNFKPEFWADGFFDANLTEEEAKTIFDGNQTPIFWSYHVVGRETYIKHYEELKKYAGKVMFGGAHWTWLGYAPDNELSDRVIDDAFDVTLEYGIDNILMTAWGDDGAECSVFAILPSMFYAAEKLYPVHVDKEKMLLSITGYTDSEWRLSDAVNKLVPDTQKETNAAKWLLHNDFLIGLMDYNTPEYAGDVYRELLPQFEKLASRDSQFAYIFCAYEALCKALIHKATYSKRLFEAYHKKDNVTIRNMVEELQIIKTDLAVFYDRFRTYWMNENKGFGFEVLDVRLGGMIGRINTVSICLTDYLEGRIEKIYELEEEHIEYFCGRLQGVEAYKALHNRWSTHYTVNCI